MHVRARTPSPVSSAWSPASSWSLSELSSRRSRHAATVPMLPDVDRHRHLCQALVEIIIMSAEESFDMDRAAASTRVLEYYLSNFFTNRVLVNFYFRLQISISGCSFLQCRLQSIDELLEFMETWGFTISFAT